METTRIYFDIPSGEYCTEGAYQCPLLRNRYALGTRPFCLLTGLPLSKKIKDSLELGDVKCDKECISRKNLIK